MRWQKRRLVNAALITLLSAVAVGAGQAPGAAQEPLPPTGKAADASSEAPTILSVLRAAPYDPAERGPLLAIVSKPFVAAKPGDPPPRLRSLSDLAEATDTRLFSAGQMNVLAPRTITAINSKPGKANPFGDLSPSDTLKLLLSTFTAAQWKLAGGANGIGLGDLTDDQKILWAQMLPEKGQVEKTKIEAGEPPFILRYTDDGLIDVRPRATGRLRLSKTLDFAFYRRGGTDIAYGGTWSGSGWEMIGPRSGNDIKWSSDPYQDSRKIGTEQFVYPAFAGRILIAPERPDPKNYRAYGAPLLIEQPNHLKTGAVDFAAPVLDKRVAFDAAASRIPNAKNAPAPFAAQSASARAEHELALLPTVGELLKHVTRATGIEWVADRRVRDLPVYLRGESARAGDVLMALALGVGGAFRKMEAGKAKDAAPLYLLTDDVEGIGARVGRLGEWADAADALRYRLLAKAEEEAAKNDPLAYLSFAPGDSLVLSDAQSKRVEEGWRAKKYGTTPNTDSAEMSPALKKAVQDFVDARVGEGVSLESGRVRIGEELRPYLLFPEVEGRAVEAGTLGQTIGQSYLQIIAFDPSKHPAEEPKASKAAVLPAPGFAAPALQKQRRILIAQPKTETEATQIVRAAIGRGISDVWLESSLADPKATADLLTKATEAGGKKIAVGAVVRLLKGNDGENSTDLGEPDRNILGETGETFRTRALSEYAGDKAFFARYEKRLLGIAGWNAMEGASAPDAAELRRRVGLIANVPNLAGLTVRATGGPGWTGAKEGGDGLFTNTAQGYTASTRRAFLRDYGIDPIDIPDLPFQLRGIRWNINFFTANGARSDYETISVNVVRRIADTVPRAAWWAFRKKRNMELMASLYKAVHSVRPALPLYTDDRLSSYTGVNTNWFGSWDTSEGLADFSPYYGSKDAALQARRTSKTVFFHWGLDWSAEETAKPDAPARFARLVSASALRNPPPAWNGLVIDLSHVPGASVPALLEGLPKTTPATGAKRTSDKM